MKYNFLDDYGIDFFPGFPNNKQINKQRNGQTDRERQTDTSQTERKIYLIFVY